MSLIVLSVVVLVIFCLSVESPHVETLVLGTIVTFLTSNLARIEGTIAAVVLTGWIVSQVVDDNCKSKLIWVLFYAKIIESLVFAHPLQAIVAPFGLWLLWHSRKC